jgi:predicted CXXCH cytochrome family protein
LKCHKEKKEEFSVKGFNFHPVITDKGCKACHNPHASNYKYQLFNRINPVCKKCHVAYKKVKRGHPVERHPVKGKRNPLHRRKKFNCASCHNPHGSIYEYLLIGSLEDFDICKKCHNY